MTNYTIIYPNETGGICVIIPVSGTTEIEALKAVPMGKPYLIVDKSLFPEDRTFRDAWTADFTNAPLKE